MKSVTYHQYVTYCGKPSCRRCREGAGHGPYWYAYQTIDGHTTRTYIGKELPPEVRAEMEAGSSSSLMPSRNPEQASIRIYTLGQFRLERRTGRSSGWQRVSDATWQHQRARSVLGCLVSAPSRTLPREQIMEALWPDQELEIASDHLDRAVYTLRKLFEPDRDSLAASPFLLTKHEVVALSDQSQVWLDADAFEHLLEEASQTSDPDEKEHLLEEASRLYTGPFLLEEQHIEWTLARRETLQRRFVGLLLALSDVRSERKSLSGAIEPLDRLLAIDPTNEAAVQRLMRLLAQLRRRGEALRAYQRLATVLRQERIAPLPKTRALYESIRRGTIS